MVKHGQPRPSQRLKALCSLVAYLLPLAVLAQSKPALAQTTAYCQLTPEAARQKETLRQAALSGSPEAVSRYREILNQHSAQVQACRRQTWPQNQAIWLRLYPCDLQPGVLDLVMDRIVNRGYNEVYVEVFYDGQALLPAADNPTPWPSVVRIPGQERADLLAQAIEKGRDRGLKVYAWMFTMNFGYNYAQRPDRIDALARNGRNQTSLTVGNDLVTEYDTAKGDSNHVFIDPYNMQAKRDYYNLVQAILQRRPDGVLFDYIRYPRLVGPASVATRVHDLWIYSQAAQNALFQRALNQKGQELIRRFLSQGYITVGDVQNVDQMFPSEGEPLWQGRNPPQTQTLAAPKDRQPLLQIELWQLSVAHALQGILDFVAMASAPAQSQGIASGVVFFPDANQVVGQGYDSRLQPWDRFPTSMEWHPMAYGVCGDVSCIVSQVQRVLAFAPQGANVRPVIAGTWGRSLGNRPSLEMQMAAIRQAAPQINSVSHFAYSWQEPEVDTTRKSCRF
ncbi:family 10 glycosylhydrolase [Desertifilum sp. FACHB-1129]|uniref:Glycosyl hydrolase-like 10 domain-containing protein n=1 Tax=Desertifilum tharense IPPAS B-1220 TaxID=1781255 RepID=A0A1E5QCZ1_9CYAN|nr:MULTISPECIES: family 10 glycosylhydrolase [Desertifilum]MDA0212868.1 family 10 glycosylhydrolase [Cyanobacteria bacterium FC1]MBD2311429.1 family 10 glycosylhydrolase [Desertifilum sp. FACHB-1129]MBD2321675.1 family 10 glycosylhydrolase [Desertifilum sp. FACHB-866]MBD2331802.1 family 10 glycosylhydrolase [Desertifilum sp. FACHB-868]OEJ72528.1 hypothetical protein BH720_23785 [Desertifilum tharense IPPAS B-1220]